MPENRSETELLVEHISTEIERFLSMPAHEQFAMLKSRVPVASPLQKPLTNLQELTLRKRLEGDPPNHSLSERIRSGYTDAILGAFYLIAAKILLDPGEHLISEYFVS